MVWVTIYCHWVILIFLKLPNLVFIRVWETYLVFFLKLYVYIYIYIYKDQDKVSKFSFYIISPVLYVLVLAIWKGYGLDPVLTPKNDNLNTDQGISKSDTLHCLSLILGWYPTHPAIPTQHCNILPYTRYLVTVISLTLIHYRVCWASPTQGLSEPDFGPSWAKLSSFFFSIHAA